MTVKLYTSVKVGHSGTSVYSTYGMVITLHIAKTTFDDDIYGYINQDPIIVNWFSRRPLPTLSTR